MSSSDEEGGFSTDEEEAGQNTYFHVQDAEPPMNFEDAYSTLPSKIKLQTIKKDICSSIKFKQEAKNQQDMQTSQMSSENNPKRGAYVGKKSYPSEKDQFWILIDTEHCDALISDAFWYYICVEYKVKESDTSGKDYSAHIEFLLDRMAANYVSYTLLEDYRI